MKNSTVGKVKVRNIFKAGLLCLLLLSLLFSACDFSPTDTSPDNLGEISVEKNAADNNVLIIENSQQIIDISDPETISLIPSDGEFVVYFLDVGQGDAAFVICDGETMLIDGGSPSSSNLIYSFLERNGIEHLDYIVNSHPHDDHIGGLSGALNYVSSVGIAIAPDVKHNIRSYESFYRYLGEHGVDVTVPDAGDTFMLGSATVTILAPAKKYNGINNNSIVLKITYGETSFLFSGDTERECELDMVESGIDLSATVLKVSHHGGEASTIYPFLREVMPQIAIISCGTNNQYRHPHDNTMSRLRDADVKVYRTDLQGDIIIISDGINLYIETQKNADVQTNPTEHDTIEDIDATLIYTGSEEYYIGNKNTKKLHRPSCTSLPNEENRVIFETLFKGLDEGHDACLRCEPHIQK